MASGGNYDKDVENLTGFFEEMQFSQDEVECFPEKLIFLDQAVGDRHFSLIWAQGDFGVIPAHIVKVAKTAVSYLRTSVTFHKKTFVRFFSVMQRSWSLR